MNDGSCLLTTVKEENIKPEITFEDDLLVVNHAALGLDNFFSFQTAQYLRDVQVTIVKSDGFIIKPFKSHKGCRCGLVTHRSGL